jgi:hypothetical protein
MGSATAKLATWTSLCLLVASTAWGGVQLFLWRPSSSHVLRTNVLVAGLLLPFIALGVMTWWKRTGLRMSVVRLYVASVVIGATAYSLGMLAQLPAAAREGGIEQILIGVAFVGVIPALAYVPVLMLPASVLVWDGIEPSPLVYAGVSSAMVWMPYQPFTSLVIAALLMGAMTASKRGRGPSPAPNGSG